MYINIAVKKVRGNEYHKLITLISCCHANTKVCVHVNLLAYEVSIKTEPYKDYVYRLNK